MVQPQFLIIHLYSNGDCLYATTIAKQLKHDYPDCSVSWAIADNCAAILSGNPFVDQVIKISIPDKAKTDVIIADLVSQAENSKRTGSLSEYFVSQITGDNFANYDGGVRSSIYRNVPFPITVDTAPVLILDSHERLAAENFVVQHKLNRYKHVILFECAPMSGQAAFSEEFVAKVANEITVDGVTAVILSSGKKIPVSSAHVYDGSVLSIRETVALYSYCTLMIGASSGITWACTAVADKRIPSVQLLDPRALVFNPPSLDYKKRLADASHFLELYQFDEFLVIECIASIKEKGFAGVRERLNQRPPQLFKIYRGLVHYFIHRRKWKLLFRFFRINIREHNAHPRMLWEMAKGVVLYPFQLRVDAASKKKQAVR